MSFCDAWNGVQDIDGWLTEGQAELLYRTASRVPPEEAIVEIGSHHGRSTVILARAKQQGTTLVAIDPYVDSRWGGGTTALAVFQRNLENHGLLGEVTHLRQFGAAAGNEWHGAAVGMLFVDGAHDYPTVLADLRAWIPHLSPNAAVLMHDAYSSPGVTLAAFRQFFGVDNFTFDGSSRSLVVFTRGAQSATGRATSCMRMLGKTPWFARNLVVKIAIRRGWNAIPPILGHEGTAFPY